MFINSEVEKKQWYPSSSTALVIVRKGHSRIRIRNKTQKYLNTAFENSMNNKMPRTHVDLPYVCMHGSGHPYVNVSTGRENIISA